MLSSRDVELIENLVEKHAAKMLMNAIDVAVATSRDYADEAAGRGAKPYDEIDYRTCELLKRQAQRIFDDSWMGLEDFTFEGYIL